MDWLIGIAILALLGLIVGALAKFLMPGDDPGGIVATSILGILGAIVGAAIANWLEIGGITGLDWRSLITAVGGSLLLLLAYRAFRLLTTASTSSSYASGHTSSATPLRAYGAVEERDHSSMPNLVDIARESLTDAVVDRLSKKVEESPGATRKALEAMIPSVLAGARSLAATPSGASRLFDLAKRAVHDAPGHHLVEGDLEAVDRQGRGILNTLFGDKLAGLLNWLARFAGIKESSATTLMNMTSSLVMSTLGRTIQQKGLDVSQCEHLLSSQVGWLSKLLPSGIGDVPGLRALTELGDRAAEAGRATVEAGRRVGATAQGAYREAVGVARQGSPMLSALLPMALLLLPLLLFTWFMRGAASRIEAVPSPAPVQPQVAERPAQPAPAQPRVAEITERAATEPTRSEAPSSPRLVPTTFNVSEVRLPDGVTLKLPESSFVHAIYKYLSDATTTSGQGQAFVFDGLDFDDAKLLVRPEIEAAVASLTSLLRAFPKATVKIEGHTDPSGDPAADRNRSLARADALKDLLVKAGVPGDRLTTAGLGSEKPVATNETSEGRAKNRRIELSFSKSS